MKKYQYLTKDGVQESDTPIGPVTITVKPNNIMNYPEKRITKKELRIRKQMVEIMDYIRKQVEYPHYPIGTDGKVYTPYGLHFTDVYGKKYPEATARILAEYVKYQE